MKNIDLKHTLEVSSNLRVRQNESLASHTTFGIGGPATFFAEVSEAKSVVALLKTSKKLGLPHLFLGGGTNLLVSDEGFEGLVIRTNFSDIEISSDLRCVMVGASVKSAALVELLVTEGLGGLEFAAGLPGTIGGAIAGNAGCFGSTLGERLVEATIILPNGEQRLINDKTWFAFDYRHSALHDTGALITEATFAIEPGDRSKLREISNGHVETRRTRHPAKTVKTAGSYFKNLPAPAPGEHRVAAGALLEKVGAMQMSVGDAAVFEKHANIVINRGSARALDILSLTFEMARRVKDTFDVTLEPEVRFVGVRPQLPKNRF